jgi:hypothetical protein
VVLVRDPNQSGISQRISCKIRISIKNGFNK